MPPLPHNDSPDLDEERKKELIMEKKLRACRVNIIQRVSSHLHSDREEVVSPLPPSIHFMTATKARLLTSTLSMCNCVFLLPVRGLLRGGPQGGAGPRGQEAAPALAQPGLGGEGLQPHRAALLEPVPRRGQEDIRARSPHTQVEN